MSKCISSQDVMSVAQYEAEIVNPSPPFRGPPPTYLRPKVADIADDDPDLVQPIPDITKQPTVSNWLTRRTKKKLAEDQLKAKVDELEAKTLEKETRFKVGDYVYSRNPVVAPLLQSKGPKGTRRVREKLHGTIMKRCEHFPQFFEVHFINNTVFYCTSNCLNFVSSSAPSSYILKKTNKNQLAMELRNNQKNEDMDKIMTRLLVSKVHKQPGCNISFASMVALFKPTYSWIDARKLVRHVKNCRNKISSKVDDNTWIANLIKLENHRESKKKLNH